MSSTSFQMEAGPSPTEALRLLECPVCLDTTCPPIFTCVNGHNVCKKCKRRLRNCPVCRAKMVGGRNFFAESVFNLCIFSCPNQQRGCGEMFKGNKYEYHISVCGYNPDPSPDSTNAENQEEDHSDSDEEPQELSATFTFDIPSDNEFDFVLHSSRSSSPVRFFDESDAESNVSFTLENNQDEFSFREWPTSSSLSDISISTISESRIEELPLQRTQSSMSRASTPESNLSWIGSRSPESISEDSDDARSSTDGDYESAVSNETQNQTQDMSLASDSNDENENQENSCDEVEDSDSDWELHEDMHLSDRSGDSMDEEDDSRDFDNNDVVSDASSSSRSSYYCMSEDSGDNSDGSDTD